jgi:NAD(P)-dependent dehydrogenase (short-subunit alcohol dehydrogenase family)
MGQRFANKTALVTGAGSGIGRATAIRLASLGAKVLCADVNEATVWQVAEDIGPSARPCRLDVTDEAGWEAAFATLAGSLDVMVNCAGVSAAVPLAEMSLGEWRRVLAINLDGAFLATKHALRAMRATGGSIVHVSSASGLKAAAGAAAYSASKAAVCMLVRAAAKECRDQGLPVRVNAVCPGGVKTPMWTSMPFFRDLVQQAGSEEAAFATLARTGGPFAESDDVVAAILFLASDEARFITGVDLVVDGGYVL